MVWIELLVGLATNGGALDKGAVVEWDAADAQRLIAARYAKTAPAPGSSDHETAALNRNPKRG